MLPPKERFKVALLARLVEEGVSLDDMADCVAELHSQVVKRGALGSIPAPVVTTPPKVPIPKANVVLPPAVKQAFGMTDILDLPGKAMDFGSKAIDFGTRVGALGVGLPIAAGLGGGYALGRATDVDDTDVEEMKQRELIDQYKRWATHINQQREMHKKMKSRERTSFGGW